MRIINSILILFSFFLLSCERENQDRVYTKIDGVYSCEESSAHSGYRKYIVEIDEVSSQENSFIISNFHNQGNTQFLFANVEGDSLSIENQVIGNLFVNGEGIVGDDFRRIEILYTTDDGRIELDYFVVFSR